MNKIRIIAADPEFLIRQGMASAMKQSGDFELIAIVSEFNDLLETVGFHQPEVVIFNYHQYKEGVEAIKTLKQKAARTGILVISDPRNQADVRKALEYGAHGYLLKECDWEEIREAITKTALRENFLCGKIVARLQGQEMDNVPVTDISCAGLNITAREIEIIRMVAEGFSNKQIAEKLFLSAHTVMTHRKNIMNKLQVNNTAGLVLYAVRNDILANNQFLFS
jgi:DNA-binding NarL/FixJ family response regulator